MFTLIFQSDTFKSFFIWKKLHLFGASLDGAERYPSFEKSLGAGFDFCWKAF
jgi:hypothetical protein